MREKFRRTGVLARGVFVFVVLVVFVTMAAAQPVVVQNPESQAVEPGTVVMLTVRVSSTEPVTIRWTRNGRWLRQRGETLQFRASRLHSGSYRALIRDASGASTWSEPAELVVRALPKILREPRDVVVREHGTAVFSTRINRASGPNTKIIWHNDNPLEGSHQIPDGLGFDVRSPRLAIPNCLNADNYNGIYWMAVTNEVGGTVSRRVRLTVVPQ
jgi:hypothetical protein